MATAAPATRSPVTRPTPAYRAAAAENTRARSRGSVAAAMARTADAATLLRSTSRYPASDATRP